MAKVCRGTHFKQKGLKPNKRNKNITESKELFKMVRKFKTKGGW
jgi:hypothetical protein